MSRHRRLQARPSFSHHRCLRIAIALGGMSLLFGAWPDECSAQHGDISDARQGKDDGYRGIWSYSGSARSNDEYRFVHYSGGFATTFAKHIPLAYYAPQMNKTFFCYAGTRKDKRQILIMVSYFDHTTATVPRPTIVLDKGTDDAHDNPAIMLDDEGYVWVFPSAHGTARPAYIFKSRQPYSVDSFELIQKTNFSYPQPWYVKGHGFLFLHTRYTASGRFLYWMTSRDGRQWSDPQLLAKVARGHYQISWRHGTRIGTAFNYHPQQRLPNDMRRTNLYYLETDDFGETWTDARGKAVELPLESVANEALVHDYEAEDLRVYLKDLNFDAQGRPVVLFLTSRGAHSGPKNDPRTWTTARWTGSRWDIRPAMISDNNYDTGCLHVELDGTWRIVAPTETGPQPYNTGGEIAVWTSTEQGATWNRQQRVTHDSVYNHTYVRRPVNAHPDFYAFWADGHAREPSPSRLYFCDRTGRRVFRLPAQMTGDTHRLEALRWSDLPR